MNNNAIAVLPFKNFSSEKQNEFFSDGITEEIINALSKIDSLHVISRTSSFFFKDKNLPLKQISEELNVNIILEGSTRIFDDQVRISATLIDAVNDSNFWSESWDRKMENIFEIQDEVSLRIAENIREQFGHFEIADHLVEKQTENLDTYQYALKARYHLNKWNPKDVRISIDLFEKALELDPQHVESVIGLSDSYSFMGTTNFMPREEAWMKSIEYTRQAYQMDPNNASVYYLLANLSFFGEFNYQEAGQKAQRSIQLNPTYIQARNFMVFLYLLDGKIDQALPHLNIALTNDPLNHETVFYKGYYHYRNSEFHIALNIFDRLLKDNPQNIPAFVVKVYVLLLQEKYDEALLILDSSTENLLVQDEKIGMLSLIQILKKEKTNPYLLELVERAKNPMAHQAHSYLYLSYVNIGELDRALDLLEKAIQIKSSVLLLIFSDPLAHKIKSYPRYIEIKNKLYQSFDEIADSKKDKAAPMDEKTAIDYTDILKTHMIEEEPFLIPNLSLRALAYQLKIHPNKLSWLLNEKLEKNFNEFINHYRVEYFKKLYLNSENNNISIVGLAYESGFNSKTVFNTYFKKETGMTPKEFLKQNIS